MRASAFKSFLFSAGPFVCKFFLLFTKSCKVGSSFPFFFSLSLLSKFRVYPSFTLCNYLVLLVSRDLFIRKRVTFIWSSSSIFIVSSAEEFFVWRNGRVWLVQKENLKKKKAIIAPETRRLEADKTRLKEICSYEEEREACAGSLRRPIGSTSDDETFLAVKGYRGTKKKASAR